MLKVLKCLNFVICLSWWIVVFGRAQLSTPRYVCAIYSWSKRWEEEEGGKLTKAKRLKGPNIVICLRYWFGNLPLADELSFLGQSPVKKPLCVNCALFVWLTTRWESTNLVFLRFEINFKRTEPLPGANNEAAVVNKKRGNYQFCLLWEICAEWKFELKVANLGGDAFVSTQPTHQNFLLSKFLAKANLLPHSWAQPSAKDNTGVWTNISILYLETY